MAGAKFVAKVPSFVRRPVSSAEARKALADRLQNRESDFLHLAAKGIYENPRSPYRRLLSLACCEYDDLVRLVRKEGVEEALRPLFRSGVYLSVNELKSRVPTIRGTTNLQVNPFLPSFQSDVPISSATPDKRQQRTFLSPRPKMSR